MKFPFGRKARQRKHLSNQAKELIDQMAANREQALEHEAEQATRSAIFQSTTVYQLQMLVDRLKEENYKLRITNDVFKGEEGFIPLTRSEAQFIYNVFDREVAYPYNEEESLFGSEETYLRARSLTGHLHSLLTA